MTLLSRMRQQTSLIHIVRARTWRCRVGCLEVGLSTFTMKGARTLDWCSVNQVDASGLPWQGHKNWRMCGGEGGSWSTRFGDKRAGPFMLVMQNTPNLSLQPLTES